MALEKEPETHASLEQRRLNLADAAPVAVTDFNRLLQAPVTESSDAPKPEAAR